MGVPGFPPPGTHTPQQTGCELDLVARWTKVWRAQRSPPRKLGQRGLGIFCMATCEYPGPLFLFSQDAIIYVI